MNTNSAVRRLVASAGVLAAAPAAATLDDQVIATHRPLPAIRQEFVFSRSRSHASD